MEYDLIINKKSVKHMSIKIKDHQTVEVVAPRITPRFVIDRFLRAKAVWIEKHLKKLAEAKTIVDLEDNQILLYGEKYIFVLDESLGKKTLVDDEAKLVQSGIDLTQKKEREAWYKYYAKQMLSDRISYYADEHGIKFNKLFIRGQKTKRGTCSSDKNISLNRKLIQFPEFVIDYVICHELAHIRHMNHSQAFWKHLDTLYPEVKKAKQWLKKYGIAVQ